MLKRIALLVTVFCISGTVMAIPVFAFFQEVPGCAGCQKFGAEVMSDPVIVAAIEAEFLPVLMRCSCRTRLRS